MYGVYVGRKKIIDIFDELDAIFEIYERKHSGYRKCLFRNTETSLKGLRIISFTYFIAVLVIMGYTLVLIFVFKKRIFIVQFFLPGLDRTSDNGFIIHTILHIFCIFIGSFGNYAGDLFFYIFCIHMPLLKDILRCKFHDMNIAIERNLPPQLIHKMFIDSLEWHQKYLR